MLGVSIMFKFACAFNKQLIVLQYWWVAKGMGSKSATQSATEFSHSVSHAVIHHQYIFVSNHALGVSIMFKLACAFIKQPIVLQCWGVAKGMGSKSATQSATHPVSH